MIGTNSHTSEVPSAEAIKSATDINGGAVVKTREKKKSGGGIQVKRRYTHPAEDVWSTVQWEKRSALISGEKGEVIFEQNDIDSPSSWSQQAIKVVASKYFRGHLDSPDRENSVRQLIQRVSYTIAGWGQKDCYFATDEDFLAFRDELTYLLLHQHAAFNSPVWFNVGLPDQKAPQCSACFINSVEDTMESILTLARTEGMLFKFGSGTGTNLSSLRSSKERLQGGGTASGPVSFMRGYDAFAGVIKSGGKTRRAAKMVMLDISHPDIKQFIQCKADEEKKAWALIDSGYNGNFNVPGGAYDSVSYQNANHSVRVSDEFMEAYEKDGEWSTRNIKGGGIAETMPAAELMNLISDSAWICGDPGMQYDTTINRWHTCKSTGPIRASNPCSEFMFLDDTSCNLSSLNLMKFRDENKEFDVDSYEHACRIMITAQEILVDNASYPTERITQNSHNFRPLGLGYANLGALLMSRGLAYDSDNGRSLAGALTAVLTGAAYHQSAIIARDHGWAFPCYVENREPMLEVMRMHRNAVDTIDEKPVPEGILANAVKCWDDAIAVGEKYGYRNAQASVLAPTGTIGFMMDCDTTGVEPDIAIVKYKSLVGGGMMKIVNQTVPEALEKLGYSAKQAKLILEYIDKNDTIEGAPGLKDEHLPVFDCAFRPNNGTRSIHYMGHIRMMSAVQPFISGAISKTVNMPHEATAKEIEQVYLEGWKLGIKAIAIYRDGSKRTQPLMTYKAVERVVEETVTIPIPLPAAPEFRPVRRKLPDERKAITHKFSIAGHEGYITVGMYDDGTPGELFLTMSKEGSTISGLMDTIATMASLSLQYGVPMDTLCSKFAHMRFEPSGITPNPDIRFAKSIPDYIFRWLAKKFLPSEAQPPAEEKSLNGNGLATPVEAVKPMETQSSTQNAFTKKEREIFQLQSDAPACADCGALMVRNGSCYKCLNCGSVFGCS